MSRPKKPTKTASTLLALLCVLGALARPATADVVDRVVLRVNDRIATLVEFEQRLTDAGAQVRASQMSPDEMERRLQGLGNEVFRDMLNEMLLLSRADQLRVRVEEEDIDQALANVRANAGIDSEDAFAAALAQQGMSLAGFREQLRDQLRLREVIGVEVRSQIELEEDDLRRFYRANPELFETPERRAVKELVVLEADDREPAELARLAAAIRQELAEGKAIEEIAERTSADGTTSGVIDLGWVQEGELAGELEAATRDLEAGQFSDPVAARGGLHILQVTEIESASIRPFSEVANFIDARERERLMADRLAEYMRELEQQAYVRAEPPASASGFRTAAGEGPGQTELERMPLATPRPPAEEGPEGR